jgi:thiol-disulfide isomerase/thioredoxin
MPSFRKQHDMNDMPSAEPSAPRRLGVAALGALVLAAGAAFLYVKDGGGGKKEASAACAAAAKTAQIVAPLAKGEVAAMAIDKAPELMPELAFNGPDGQPMKLSDFRGKTVLLNFWATWCVPCRQEMGALDKLQQAAGSEKFQVVAVNIDTSRLDRPKALLAEIGAKTLTYYADPKAEVFFQLKTGGKATGLPTTFLVDPAGCALGLMSGPAAWDSEDGKALVTRAAGGGA